MQIPTLPLEAAVALLKRGVIVQLRASDAWHSIARWVGSLPLALELLNSAFQRGASVERLLEEAKQRGPAVELEQQWTLLRPYVPEGAVRGVAEAFATSLRTLPPTAQLAAYKLAFLSPAPIPGRLVDLLIGDLERRALRVHSFIGPAPQGKEVEIYGRMHRVLSDYLASCQPLSDQEPAALFNWRTANKGSLRPPSRTQSLAGVLTALEQILQGERLKDPANWPLIRACVPHLEWFYSSALRSLYGTPAWERVGALLRNFGAWLHTQGVTAGRHLGEGSPVATLEAELDTDHPKSMLRTFEAAAGFHMILKPDAPDRREDLSFERLLITNKISRKDRKWLKKELPAMERVFRFRQKHLPVDHAATLQAQYDLAKAFFYVEEWQQARDHFQNLVDSCLRHFGPQHPNTRSCFFTLSLIVLKTTKRSSRDWQQFLDKHNDILKYFE